MKRTANSVWKGGGKEGNGTLTTGSGVLNETAYDHASRFADGSLTNPEELIAAAHAGCFNMKLSFVVGNSGYTPDYLNTTCTITHGDDGISNADLVLEASIPGISEEEFEAAVTDATENCPVSAVLDLDISVEATLVE